MMKASAKMLIVYAILMFYALYEKTNTVHQSKNPSIFETLHGQDKSINRILSQEVIIRQGKRDIISIYAL